MSRTRNFDEDAVRQAIMRVFWERGYEATNLGQLEKATSLVRTSLYNAFGNKAEMFAGALQHYHTMIEQLFDQMMQDQPATALTTVFGALMDKPGDIADWPTGCLMVGAATQSATLEPQHLESVCNYRAMLVSKVAAVLTRDQAAGRITQSTDPDSAAELLVCVMWGALASLCIDHQATGAIKGLGTLQQILSGWALPAPH